MNDQRARGAWIELALRGGELAFAVVAALVFFMFFLGLIVLTFPQGGGLEELILRPQWDDDVHRGSGLAVERPATERVGSPVIARLARTHRSVKDRRAEAISWNPSRSGIRLEDHHAVQTFDRSAATIRFDAGGALELDANSLVVLRGADNAREEGASPGALVLFDGRLAGGIEDSAALPLELVSTSGASLRVREGGASQFRMSVNPDRSSTFVVLDGVAEVASAGSTLRLGPREMVTVAASRPPGAAEPLPGTPRLVAPPDGQVYAYRSLPPRVRFAWDGAGAAAHRIVIGSDPKLEEIVADEIVRDDGFTHGNLVAGRYYWRVAGMNGWAEGEAGELRRLDLVQDDRPPVLNVTFPESIVPAGPLLLRGSAEPGADVFVGQLRLEIGLDGAFAHAFDLSRGLNLVTFEAVDLAGNVTYRSRLIPAGLQPEEGSR